MQQQLGMGLQMGDIAAGDQGAGCQQQRRETVDHGQQDPAVEATGDAGHEAADDEADQRSHVQHAEVLAGMGGQYFAADRHAMGGQGQADTGKQRNLPDRLGAEQQVQ